jgi:hypothetical protein
MNVGFLFMARKEINNSYIWKEYFETESLNYTISVYSDIGYEIKNDFFKKFQVIHNINKSREMNLEVKYDFLKKNIDKCDYFIFLTEDSVPVKKINILYKVLSELNSSVFGYGLDPHVSLNDGRSKYGQVRKFKFPEEYRYKNDDWLCLCKKHAEILVANMDDCYSFNYNLGGEHFVSSILNKNNELINVIPKNFIIENWDGYNGRYPSTFTKSDIDKIKSIISNNEFAFFLRKFNDDLENIELINKLYDNI